MQPPPIISAHEQTFVVEPSLTITFEPLPPVLSTPSLIGLLERTARELLRPFLDVGEVSVGTHVDVEHLAPALTGAEVRCRARVLNVDGPNVNFQVEATSSGVTLARGTHRRCAVETSRLLRRLERLK